MQRIIFHWTAGTSKPNQTDMQHYHFLIDGDGAVHNGRFKPESNLNPKPGKYAAHTLNCNTGSIGVALCGMAGAVENPFLPGKHPITEKQWDALVKLCARLCRKYKIAVTEKTLLSHAEVQPNLGIAQRGKWDVSRLPWDRTTVGARAVGNLLRREVLAELMKTAPAAPQPSKASTATPPLAAIKEKTMNKDIVLGIIRHALTWGGGFIAAKGYIDAAAANEIVGAVMTLIGIGWSVADKKTR